MLHLGLKYSVFILFSLRTIEEYNVFIILFSLRTIEEYESIMEIGSTFLGIS